MKFLHAADIHLDSPLHGLERYEGAPVDEIRNATRQAFDNLVDLAVDEGVDFVLLVGDLYDGDWKDYNTGLFFVNRMARLQDAGIRAFIVAGNHDAASQITKHLPLPENVKNFSTEKPETEPLENLNVAIHGQGYATREVNADISRNYPQGDPQLFNIGMLHTSLDGRPGHESYAPCTIDGLKSKGYQYWALGHVHKREVVSEEPWIVYPGNVQGRHIRESGPKGCTLVTVEDGDVVNVEHRDLDVMRWLRIEADISSSKTVDDVYNEVRNKLTTLYDAAEGRLVAARLTLVGNSDIHGKLQSEREHLIQEWRALANEVGRGEIWLEKILFDISPLASLQDALNQDNALSVLLGAIVDTEISESTLSEFIEELTPLHQKLPHQILTGDDAWDPTNPEMLRRIAETSKQDIIYKLLSGK